MFLFFCFSLPVVCVRIVFVFESRVRDSQILIDRPRLRIRNRLAVGTRVSVAAAVASVTTRPNTGSKKMSRQNGFFRRTRSGADGALSRFARSSPVSTFAVFVLFSGFVLNSVYSASLDTRFTFFRFSARSKTVHPHIRAQTRATCEYCIACTVHTDFRRSKK